VNVWRIALISGCPALPPDIAGPPPWDTQITVSLRQLACQPEVMLVATHKTCVKPVS